MLERAKACLKSGAQQSLRCANANTATRSKRMLHSTFWNHAAGDLDLPPWAVSTSVLSDLSLKHDSKGLRSDSDHRGGKRKGNGGTWASPSDGVFLDFLYPPQALAWMRRSHGQYTERWERRNARRLPEGFIQASRGYSSRSYGQAAQARADDPKEVQEFEAVRHHGVRHNDVQQDAESIEAAFNRNEDQEEQHGEQSEREDQLGLAFDDAEAFVADPQEASTHDGEDVGLTALRAESSAQNDDWSGVDFGDSPADLAELHADAMQRLRQTLSMRSKKPEAVGRVLRTYDTLDPANKGDLRLKVELLEWLSHHHSSEADVRCAEIYRSLPLEQRTLPIYQAALSIFLRRGLHVQAVKLHKEALKNIANGTQITKTFFQYAVDENRWQLAMNVEAQFRLVLGPQARAKQDMFWLQVSGMPNLILKAIKLAAHLQILKRANTVNEQTHRFAARFFSEALIQEFHTTDHTKSEPAFGERGVPSKSIGGMFDELHHLDEDAPQVFQKMLSAMLGQQHPNYRFAKLHRVISYVYLAFRDTGAVMSEGLLMALLERLTRFWNPLRKQKEDHHSLTIATIVKDWQHHYGKLSRDGVKCLLNAYASQGRIDRFDVWSKYYKEHYPKYEDQKAVLHSTIYVHARRGDLVEAKKAFNEAVNFTNANDDSVSLQCWNVLIHAYSRADSLEGGLETLQNLVDVDLKPDEFSFHPIMEMLAKRGDVDGVKDMLSQYDALADKKREAAFFGSLITAHANCNEIDEAEAVLKTAVDEVKSGKVRGSLTGSFNNVLAAYALRRNVDATIRVYRWMREASIRFDADTFGALIQALTVHRQTQAADKILRTVMKEQRVRPTAFHYALLMTGYVSEGKYTKAVEVHDRMRDDNVRPSFSSNTAYLRAKALKEQRDMRRKGKPANAPLTETIVALRNVLQHSRGNDIAAKQPQLGTALVTSSGPLGITARYISFIILLHGRRKCFQAVRKLHEQYKSEAAKRAPDARTQEEPMLLLTALMTAYLRAGDWEEVESCWKLCNEQADELAKRVPVPQIKPLLSDEEPPPDILELQPPIVNDAQEAGFRISNGEGATKHGTTVSGQSSSPPPAVKQALITEGPRTRPTTRPSPGRHYILSRPLRYYLYSLAAQGRTSEILSTVAKLFGQGYTLDNRTWNVFISVLCQSSPPLVLLAFTLTERFLIPHFPGWAPVNNFYRPNKSARAEGLQYIRARYLRPGQLMPQYRTLVVLGAALLKLRRVDAMGRQGMWNNESMKGMERYVGTAKQIRQQAPKTMFVVQSMPMVDDALQKKLLRRG